MRRASRIRIRGLGPMLALGLLVTALAVAPAAAVRPGPLAAVADTVYTVEDTPVTFDPLDNDTGPLVRATAWIVGAPLHGGATIDGDGRITYTPEPGYNGDDLLEYGACDGNGDCRSARVSLRIALGGRYAPVFTRIGTTSFTRVDAVRTDNDGTNPEVISYLGSGNDAFVRYSKDGNLLAIVSGASLQVKNRAGLPWPEFSIGAPALIKGVDWSPGGTSLVVWMAAPYPEATLYTLRMPATPLDLATMKFEPLTFQSGESTIPIIGMRPSWEAGAIYFDTFNDLEGGASRPGIFRADPAGMQAPTQVMVDSFANSPDARSDGAVVYATKLNGVNWLAVRLPNGTFQYLLATSVSWPQWSPDGRKIIYEAGSGSWAIRVVNADGTNPTFLSWAQPGYLGGYYPTWDPVPMPQPTPPSKTGGLLAFVRGSSQVLPGTGATPGGGNLWLMRPNGSGLTDALDAGPWVNKSIAGPSFSPNGQYLAFSAQPLTGPRAIFVRSLDGTTTTKLTSSADGLDAVQPAWSPDGSRIAFVLVNNQRREIWVMNSDGTNKRRITTIANQFSQADYSPAWSPDGTRISFLRGSPSSPATLQIWLVRPDGTDAAPIGVTSTVDGFAWSPAGGGKVALVRPAYSNTSGTSDLTNRIQTATLVDGLSPQLTDIVSISRFQGTTGTPQWSPDGTSIVFVRAEGGRPAIWSITADGRREMRLSSPGNTDPGEVQVAWGPAGPPQAEADSYVTAVDQPLVVDAPGVLGNDISSDPSLDLIALIGQQPANGAVLLNLDGSFTYTPNPGFAGWDSFTYRARQGGDYLTSLLTTVSIDVQPPPSATVDGPGGPVTIIAPLTSGLADVSVNPLPVDPPPTGFAFPYGMVGFTVNGIAPAAAAVVTLDLPGPADHYFKYDDGVWSDATSLAAFAGNRVTLTLQDGGPGDADGVVNGTIVDPGAPALLIPPPPPTDDSISVGDARVVEGDSGKRSLVVPVTLSRPAAEEVTVTATIAGVDAAPGRSTAPGADFDPGKPRQLRFKPGATGLTPTTRLVTIPIHPDVEVEIAEQITVTLSGPSAGWELGRAVGTGTIVDDDGAPKVEPTISIGSVSVVEGASGARVVKVAVTLSAPVSTEVAVDYRVVSDSATCGAAKAGVPLVAGTDCWDQKAATRTLKFKPGRTGLTSTARVISLVVYPDDTTEPDEQFHIELANGVGALLGATVGPVTILDDD